MMRHICVFACYLWFIEAFKPIFVTRGSVTRRLRTTKEPPSTVLTRLKSSWTDQANFDEQGAKIWLPSPPLPVKASTSKLGSTQVSPEIFEEGNWWAWTFRDAETKKVVAEEMYVIAQVLRFEHESITKKSGSSGGRMLIDIAAGDGEGGWFPPHHRIDMDLDDALEAHDDPDDEPHWDFRGYYERCEPGEEAEGLSSALSLASSATGASAKVYEGWRRIRGASEVRQLFESRFNLLKVRAEGDRNFKLEIMNGEFGCESLGLGTSEHGSEAADTALFRATRIDAEEWVKSNGDEMWCTHRAWKDTGAYHLQDPTSPICGLAIFNPTVAGPPPVFYPAANSDDGKRRKLTLELSKWSIRNKEVSSEETKESNAETLRNQARSAGMAGNEKINHLVEEEAKKQIELEEALKVLETQSMLAKELGMTVKELEDAMEEIENGIGLEAFLADIEAGAPEE